MRTPDNMSDEELDALFRRGAEAYPDEVHLGAWARMEDQLYATAVEDAVRRRLGRWFAAEVIVVGLALGLWQGLRPADSTPVGTEPRPTVSAPAPGTTNPGGSEAGRRTGQPRTGAVPQAPQATQPGQKQPDSPADPAQQLASPGEKAAPASATAPSRSPVAAAVTPRPRYSGSRVILTPAVPPRPKPSFPKRERVEKGAAGQSAASATAATAVVSPPAARGSVAENTAQNPLKSPETAAQPAATAPTPAPAATTPIIPPAPEQTLPVATATPAAADTTGRPQPVFAAPPTPADSANQAPPERKQPAYRLNLGVLGAPALSAVRRPQTARAGGDLGLALEYHLTNRWHVRVAAIRSVQRYIARISDYSPPEENLRFYVGVSEVRANCRITEFPLDLRYDVVQQPAYTIFAATGLTSLLMRNERYDYEQDLNGQISTTKLRFANGSSHVAALLNLSAGVERQLGGPWAAQAEPFLRLPLGGVGYGKVRLSNAGVSFSVKYSLLPLR